MTSCQFGGWKQVLTDYKAYSKNLVSVQKPPFMKNVHKSYLYTVYVDKICLLPYEYLEREK